MAASDKDGEGSVSIATTSILQEYSGMNKELPQEKRTRCEIWTRVMGYHRPVSGWNLGKQSEFHERKYFKESVMETEIGKIS